MSTLDPAHPRYAILGPLELRHGRRAVEIGGPRQVALLAMLLVNANRAVPADSLIDALWGDLGPAGAVKRLQVAIARLRRTLGAGDDADGSALRTVAGGYLLAVRAGELDADVFRTRVEEGRRALEQRDPGRARDLLREALELWRGPPLGEVAYHDFALAEIRRLEELRLAAHEARVEAQLALGDDGALIGELESLVAAHPARERLAGQLMLALYRCGRQGEALEVHARTRAYLSRELGLEPGPALHALQGRILAQDPSLDGGGRAERRPSTRPDPAAAHPLPSALTAAARDPFVGRAQDLAALADALVAARGGAREVVLLHGEPGIGKTRLAAEFARRAHAEGAIVLYGRCDREALLAQQPFVEALRHLVCGGTGRELVQRLGLVGGELRRVVPELPERVADLPEPLAGDPDGARSRLFEAISSLLCEATRSAPLVLVLDDLHWADQSTLQLLKYVVRRPGAGRLMVLGTFRETELEGDHPLSATLADLGRERLCRQHALQPLDAAAVDELVGVHAGGDASPRLRRVVLDGTEGNPFFVVELVRHLSESGAIDGPAGGGQGDGAGRLEVPDGIRQVIDQRLARLGPETSRLLATASVLGRTFDADVLARMGEIREDDLLDALDLAVRARVIEEVPGAAGRHTFAHALIRDTLYGGLTATRRAVLHRRAGAALESARHDDLEPHLAALAHHFAQAGAGGDLEKAIEYGARAGERAISLLAYEQAAAHFAGTADLIGAAASDELLRRRCDLLVAQGEAERQAGDPAYRQTLLDAARLAERLDDAERLARAALANNRGFTSSAEGVDVDRVAVLRAALRAHGDADSPTRAALLALLAVELVSDEDWRMRDGLCDEALAIARRIGHPRTLAIVLTQRAVARWRPDTLEELRAQLREAGELADRLDDRPVAGQAAYLGAHAAMEAGDLADADELLARLRVVAEQLGQPSMRWYAAVVRAKRRSIAGPAEEAERLAFAALELGTASGQPDVMLWFLGQLLVARFLSGRLDAGDPHLPDLFESPESAATASPELEPSRTMPLLIAASRSAVLAEVGRLEDARRQLDALMAGSLGDLPHDYTALAIPALASVACARLQDAASARRLHALLEPHGGRFVNTGTSWLGATDHWLGALAATLGRAGDAHARFAAAERTYASLGAEPWLERLRADRTSSI